ncbi:NAD(P)-dependent alcohol dehydrogenase [Actinosynnema pretiosum]|uniref:NAD(P)-dependent alcohol dehydrogenase n=1 Tax=Actinosynnema pretiosum TaxID=42197 RepID=A0A290ZDN0_9PSEU|nr:NAD(P)-dependent alcohol dehydrogenase [Actinosynnema pretiosum]ATE57094.1 NAD(P)-dependent alcohol dehydrogenase [Actinosynnema pretiosum]
MRAARYHRFGPPDVLRVEDVPDPEPGPGEVLVRVRAASVEGGEQSFRSGKLRLLARGPFPRGVGTGFSGHVAALGAGVRGRRVGDPVWGLVPHLTTGSVAELVVVPQDRIARAPGNLDLLAAAALPVSGTTAITALRHEARLVAGERLLVRGAAGGVGSALVRFGKSLGAHVTALASARDLDRVTGELGADEALDHRATRPGDLGRFDVVVDVVGTELPAYRRLLTAGGRIVPLAFDHDRPLASLATTALHAALAPHRVKLFSNNPSAERLAELTAAAESGALRPDVDTVFALADVADAHRALEAGGVRGKHLVEVQP